MLLFLIILLFLLLSFLLYQKNISLPIDKRTAKDPLATQESLTFYIVAILIAALISRICLATCCYESGDHSSFMIWINTIRSDGVFHFYYKHGLSYPPLYLYILAILGHIIDLFKIEPQSVACIVLLKLPAIIADLFSAYLILRITSKHDNEKTGILFMLLFLLNPAIITNSSLWGQVDSIYTLFIVLTCYLIYKERFTLSYFMFTIAVLLKYQSVIFTPVILFTLIHRIAQSDHRKKEILQHLRAIFSCIGLIVVCYLPFLFNGSLRLNSVTHIADDYSSTLKQFPYASVNAFNFWYLLGHNWEDQEHPLFFMTYRQWGTLFILIAVILAALCFIRRKNECLRSFVPSMIILSTMFLFSVRMHERYLYPVIFLSLTCFALSRKKELFYVYVSFSVLNFYNTAYILFYNDTSKLNSQPGALITSAVTLLTWIYLIYCTFHKKYINEETI